MSKGFIYRAGIAIKEFGERIHFRLAIRLGLAVKDSIMNCPVKEM